MIKLYVINSIHLDYTPFPTIVQVFKNGSNRCRKSVQCCGVIIGEQSSITGNLPRKRCDRTVNVESGDKHLVINTFLIISRRPVHKPVCIMAFVLNETSLSKQLTAFLHRPLVEGKI